MDITTMITTNTVELDVDLKSKEEALSYITEILEREKRITSKEETFKGYVDREEQCTTGIGFGLAIPHCKVESVVEPTIVYLTLKNPVDWQALDDKPVKIVIGLAVPKKDEGTLHLEILSSLASNLMEDEFKDSLFSMNSKNDLIKFLYNNL
ncbi:PTS sugar transporter subunit IIA [Clostridium ganghwense]|uniref:Fructose PTS transporter subunit IIA n=1 Tax=Clostridium ganghwense TaxID=312089 RepID=A0ABT4CJX3_9CLOT|nr:fructose PTS transporter subunit IIA [Clostridium ganghwense]MCY6369355.1 fructose PTS transporter subunit IIA [Clostridium ganghwense]